MFSLFGEHMRREEAIALMKELSVGQLLEPTVVLLEERTPDNYQLRVKADCDRHGIEIFVGKFNWAIEEDKEKGFLTIFKPQKK